MCSVQFLYLVTKFSTLFSNYKHNVINLNKIFINQIAEISLPSNCRQQSNKGKLRGMVLFFSMSYEYMVVGVEFVKIIKS